MLITGKSGLRKQLLSEMRLFSNGDEILRRIDKLETGYQQRINRIIDKYEKILDFNNRELENTSKIFAKNKRTRLQEAIYRLENHIKEIREIHDC